MQTSIVQLMDFNGICPLFIKLQQTFRKCLHLLYRCLIEEFCEGEKKSSVMVCNWQSAARGTKKFCKEPTEYVTLGINDTAISTSETFRFLQNTICTLLKWISIIGTLTKLHVSPDPFLFCYYRKHPHYFHRCLGSPLRKSAWIPLIQAIMHNAFK